MGYGAVYSDDQRGDGDDFDRALADWRALQDHPDIAVYVDSGGRASAHRRDTLVVAEDDLYDTRLVDNREDLGISLENLEEARGDARDRALGFGTLALGTGQCVVAATTFLRGLGGRRPLRVGPDHCLWPMQGRTMGPATPPIPARSPSSANLQQRVAKAVAADAPVLVAVLDSGLIEGNDLVDACTVASEPDTRWDQPNLQLDHWVGAHGTHVAGVLAAAADGAVRIRHFNVANSFGDHGLPIVADTDLAGAVARALGDGCRVLNLSLGGPTALDLGLTATSLVVRGGDGLRTKKGLQADDAVIVASAGNEGTSQPMFPAALKGVVAVGAIKANGDRAKFSNFGSWVDCATGGVDVLGPHVNGHGAAKPDGTRDTFRGWAKWSGTSFAAPFVAGRIAAQMAGPSGLTSARVAAATVLSLGTPLDPALGLGVRVS